MSAPISATLLLLLTALTASAASSTPEFHERVISTYNFAPHRLSHAERAKKSKELDAFWNATKHDPAQLDALRAELRRDKQPIFFYYDGAKLLLSASSSRDDRQLALNAIVRTDLVDVTRDDYFCTVRNLGNAGLDVTEAALHILDEPGFKVIVPQHALTLDADFALIFMLNSVDEAIYVPRLIERLERSAPAPAKVAALTALWYSLDRTALDYVDRLKIDGEMPAELKARVAELQKRDQTYRGKGGGWSSEAALRAKRKKALQRVGDEALSEYED